MKCGTAIAAGLACLFSSPAAPSWSAEHRAELAAEWLHARDVDLTQVTAQGFYDVAGWDATGSLAVNRFAIDYAPVSFDFQGVARHRTETNVAFQVNARRQRGENWTWLAGAEASMPDSPTTARSGSMSTSASNTATFRRRPGSIPTAPHIPAVGT